LPEWVQEVFKPFVNEVYEEKNDFYKNHSETMHKDYLKLL
jgi:hypothetical protein